MPLNKPTGKMYPWAYTWNPIAGECQHACDYCYVSNKIAPWTSRMGNPKYYGEPKLIESELETKLVVPEGYLIFVESCGDLFGSWIPNEWILRILARIRKFPQTTFLLQTKNPKRYLDFEIPENCILGTTIETNREYSQTKAPQPKERYLTMKQLPPIRRGDRFILREIMISIEPVMDFDLATLFAWMEELSPTFVSIGADSGKNNLPEPSAEKLKQFLENLDLITEVRKKQNLHRLLQQKPKS